MTVKEYIELNDRAEINTMLRFSERARQAIDHYGIGDVMEWDFDIVKEMQATLQDLNFLRAVTYMHQLGVKNIGRCELIKAIQNYNYLIEQIKKSIELENELLKSESDSDSIMAGIEELEEIGIYLQLRQIAIALHYSIEQVKKMKYKDALLELVAQKRINDYQKRLTEIKLKKSLNK